MVWEDVGVSGYLFGPVSPAQRQVISKCCDFIIMEEIHVEEGSRYPMYMLVKEKIDTLGVLNQIKRALGCADIGYCGLKDKLSLSVQYLTLHRCSRVPEVLHLKRAMIKRVNFVDSKLNVGGNLGNVFIIKIRGAEVDGISGLLTKVSNRIVFPNYVGYQRFGLKRPYTHELGLAFLKAAIEGPEQFEKLIRYKKGAWESLFMVKRVLPKEVEMLLIQAVQSFYFNKCLSILLEEAEVDREKMRSGVLIGFDLLNQKYPSWVSVRHLECVKDEAQKEVWLLNALKMKGIKTRFRPLFSTASISLMKLLMDGLLLLFRLSPGSYATAFIRELVGDSGSVFHDCTPCLSSARS